MPDGRTSQPRQRPSTAGAVLLPGVPTLGFGVERYVAEGGAATVFSLEPGDRVTLRDREGRQPAEIAGFAPDGSADTDALGAAANGEAGGLKAILGAGDERSRSLAGSLQRRGLDIAGARSIDVLGGESRPGDEADFTAERPLVCFVAAPGGPMRVDRQDPPTPIEIFVARANPAAPGEPRLPEPLADPRIDRRVAARTAEAYEVKAGEFIQIVDVEGRECSDFQAFTVAGLDGGRELCLDATATRTLMGSAYPAPGLLSKFYDPELQPMVELVRDTCGRHDSFLFACTAKYYDDMGYPGHVNCTDNFNAALAPFGIAPRRGWIALNFFFNTGFDDANQAFFDDPWSRPGDYVLLRALTDLVCVSSACPDDIDAANGWNPTDIHVRVYPREERVFQSGGLSHDSRRRSQAHPRDRIPQPVRRAHPQFRRIQRLLAGRRLRQPRRAGRVLGLPRAGGRDGSFGAAQVRGAGAGRRTPDAMDADAQHAPAGDRPGGLFRHVLRDRRHDRRRHRLPPRRRQFPLGRRLRLRRRVDARAGRKARPQCLGAVVDRPAAQPGRPGAEEPRHPQGGGLDAAGAAVDRRPRLVPLCDRTDRRSRRHTGRGLAHRLYRRAGLRAVVPSARCRRRVGRGLAGRRTAAASRPSGWMRSTWSASRPG